MDKECKCKQPNYNPVGRCLICGNFQPAGTFPDTQLPAEVLEEIKLKANAFAVGMWPIATNHAEKQRKYVAAVHEAGATEYAIKLHTATQMLFRLASLVNADQKPDEMFLTEIKTFLDGTK